MNPRGVGITNIILHAELAAAAAAIIHGYSHIATGSLTSMHQIIRKFSHPNLHRHHIQGDVPQLIAKAIHQSPSLIHFCKVKSHAGIIGNEYADNLLENQSQPTLTLRMPLSQQPDLREIPSTTLLACKRI
jgi:ribonuclease HI